MTFKKLLKFALNNYFISIFIACILFVGFVSVFKLFFTKPTYVYARVKVGQGLWWASTQRPSWWFVQAIKPGMAQKDLVGKPIAQILSVHYYPWYGSGQYDVYVNLKLKVTVNKRTGEYSFNRSTIGTGSPVDLEFPSTQFSGTIIRLDNTLFDEKFTTKIITLTKQYAYPWEYDQIKIGDSYFDGKDTVFKILDKNQTDTNQYLPTESSSGYPGSVVNSSQTIARKYVTIKAEIKVKESAGQFLFGEEQIIAPGKTISIATPNFTFNDFVISQIQ